MRQKLGRYTLNQIKLLHDIDSYIFEAVPSSSISFRKFKDKVYPWPPDVSTYKQHYCGMETLETKGASSNDQGDYTCTVTSSNGTVVTKTMELNVSRKTLSLSLHYLVLNYCS